MRKASIFEKTMLNNLCFVLVDNILLCGDVHPQSGPFQRAKGVSKKDTTQDSKSFTDQTKNKKRIENISCPLPISTFVLWRHTNIFTFLNRQLPIIALTSLQSLSHGWTIQYVTRIFLFWDIQLSGKIEGHSREVEEYSFMLKTSARPLPLKKWSSVSETNFQQLWVKVHCKKFKSFFFCTVYRPLDAPIDLLENVSETFVDSLLHGLNVIILRDLNYNLIGGDPDGRALSDFCSTFGLSRLVKTPTRGTEKSKSLIAVALTTNENIIHACDVTQSAISDHSLVNLILKLKTPKPKISFLTTRSYKTYVSDSFIEDLADVAFHIVNLFDDPDDQVHAFNCLF